MASIDVKIAKFVVKSIEKYFIKPTLDVAHIASVCSAGVALKVVGHKDSDNALEKCEKSFNEFLIPKVEFLSDLGTYLNEVLLGEIPDREGEGGSH